MPRLFKLLGFAESQKVGLGLWVFFPMLGLFLFSVVWNAVYPPLVGSVAIGITFDQFMIAVGIATTLVGGGTLLDKQHTREMKKIDANGKPETPAAA